MKANLFLVIFTFIFTSGYSQVVTLHDFETIELFHVSHFKLDDNCFAVTVPSTPAWQPNLEVIPNPAGSAVNISFFNDGNEETTIEVFDRGYRA